jgi:hypothetical protein
MAKWVTILLSAGDNGKTEIRRKPAGIEIRLFESRNPPLTIRPEPSKCAEFRPLARLRD